MIIFKHHPLRIRHCTEHSDFWGLSVCVCSGTLWKPTQWYTIASAAKKPPQVWSRWSLPVLMGLSCSTATPWFSHASAAKQNAWKGQRPNHSAAGDADHQ